MQFVKTFHPEYFIVISPYYVTVGDIMIWIIIGAVFAALFALCLYSCLIAASRADDAMEKMRINKKPSN